MSKDLSALKFLVQRAPAGRERRHPYQVGLAVPQGIPRRAGFLHDLVEDGYATIEEIKKEFDAHTAEAVDALTRRDEETYMQFILRVKKHTHARLVKIADIENNLSTLPPEHSLRGRYGRALNVLRAAPEDFKEVQP